MIEVFCDCGNRLVIFPHHAGTTMDCPRCGETVDVPGEREAPRPRTGPVVTAPETWFSRLLKRLRGD